MERPARSEGRSYLIFTKLFSGALHFFRTRLISRLVRAQAAPSTYDSVISLQKMIEGKHLLRFPVFQRPRIDVGNDCEPNYLLISTRPRHRERCNHSKPISSPSLRVVHPLLRLLQNIVPCCSRKATCEVWCIIECRLLFPL